MAGSPPFFPLFLHFEKLLKQVYMCDPLASLITWGNGVENGGEYLIMWNKNDE